MTITARHFQPLLAAVALAASACGTSSKSAQDFCQGGKCDDPGSKAERDCAAEVLDEEQLECFKDCRRFTRTPVEGCVEQCGGDVEEYRTCRDPKAIKHCEKRRGDALDSSQRAFTKNELRWACADVDGVNTHLRDSRGQEYCEYFPVVQLPPETEGGTELPPVRTPGLEDPLSLELSVDQIGQLEDADPSAVVGECIFTSWHSDIDEPLPVCEGGCPELAVEEGAELPAWAQARELGLPLEARHMQMRGPINSNFAAADLFQKCLMGPPERDYDADMDDHYMRGCMKSYELFTTEWRRSDPSVCVVGARLRECNCAIDKNGNGVVDDGDVTDVKGIAQAIVPPQPDDDGNIELRGFHLGTWGNDEEPGRNRLPPGCRYLETGDTGTKTLVACRLTASDVLSSAGDLKGRCGKKYGDNVVVHVPGQIDLQHAVVCEPDPDAPHTADCGNMPWLIGNEDAEKDEPEPEPEPEPKSCDFDVCAEHDAPAPEDCNACTEAVSSADPFCADSRWDSVCVGLVAQECDASYQCEAAAE